MDNLYSIIGSKIKARRIVLGLTQQDLAGAIDIKRTSITNLESGRQCLPLDKLYILCEFLELSIYDVIPPSPPLPERTDRVTIDGKTHRVSPKVAAMIRAAV